MDPVIWFFVLGLVSRGWPGRTCGCRRRSDDLLSTLLLITIGLKGGVELARSPLAGVLPQAAVVLAIGFVLPLFVFPLLRAIGRFGRADAASLAAHYGSVSVATFAVGVAYLGERNVANDSQLPLFLVLLEVPAIVVGILLARGLRSQQRWGKAASRNLSRQEYRPPGSAGWR